MSVEYSSSTVTKMDIHDFSVYASRNRNLKVSTVCLGVLCVVLLAVVIGQAVHYHKVEQDLDALNADKDSQQESLKIFQKENRELKLVLDQLQVKAENLNAENNQLKRNVHNLTTEKTQLERRLDSMTAERNNLTATVQDKTCPAGWRKFQCSCYFIHLPTKTWSQSRSYCQSNGSDLAIINSQGEMEFLNGLCNSDIQPWIGLTDGGVEGQWKWVDGTPLNQSFWAKDQPNSYQGTDQDCVEIWHRATGHGAWNDEICSAEQSFICEK